MDLMLGITFSQCLFAFGIGWVAYLPNDAAALVGLISAVLFAVLSLVTTAAVIFGSRHGATLTDRRLLLVNSRRGAEPTQVALSDVACVHGTTKGSWLPIQVETRDGRFVTFFELCLDRRFGLAIAEASGSAATPQGKTAREQIAELLYRSDRLGLLCSVGSTAVLATLVLNVTEPDFLAFGAVGLALALFAIGILLMLLGMMIGRVAGQALMVLWLRPRYGAEEMRDAFRLLSHRRLLPCENDEFRFLQHLIWWVAGLLYGQRFELTLPERVETPT